ncbi:MAG: ATP-binding protein [Flavobacteriaceae bacterium]
MINKRILIKNLLAYNDENSFFDRKRLLNLHTKEGKAKFLKHICALSNSNPENNSYIVVGVEDNNEISGTDFYDDSRIQNLVNANLENPPEISYENIPFPNLPKDKVIGLVTIRPNSKKSFFKKTVWNIAAKTSFIRVGSNSNPIEDDFSKPNSHNKEIVQNIELNSRNSIKDTLDAVMDFVTNRHKGLTSKYKVFKELFVICWAGIEKKVNGKTFWTRVDIELVNEQIKLFYSTLDEVKISYNQDSFTITEYVPLGINGTIDFYPLERTEIHFFNNGYYKIETEMLFNPPVCNKKTLFHMYNSAVVLLSKIKKKQTFSDSEKSDLENLPSTLLVCYLNGFDEALEKLIDAKVELKENHKIAYQNFKEVMRIQRKIKY